MAYDFDSVSFHDNAIHGIFLPESINDGVSPLRFDIDHITEWSEHSVSGKQLFSVSQGILSFYNVTDLRLNIEWAISNYTASEVGVYIIDIKREAAKTTLCVPQYYKWEIITNSKNYSFSFGASSTSIILLGNPKLVDRQYLLGDERISISGLLQSNSPQ
ncbi:hypothetical protein BA086_24975 [Salmonella enterica]|uniref:Uncharacterized protein n=1 Tax=Salmonella enterica TaxID=28901 RepID=A0A402XLD5_SALER|nr:hypothetical protein [Salmonella enterica]EBQ2951182.1 hypothetical protein [Salmonella enterica]MIV66193.1 hypothetical protein [Salmonella enterica]